MRHRYGLALLFLLAPAAARAQDAPERLLPAGTQIYLRWDGIDAHRAAYAKTGLGKMLQGDTGTFVKSMFGQLEEGLGGTLAVAHLLEGLPPDQLKARQDDVRDAARLLGVLGKHGFIFAVEVRSVLPPSGQVTFLIPGAGDRPAPLFAALRLAAGAAKVPVKTKKIEGRTLTVIDLPFVHLAWWAEGKHAVLNLSTDDAEEMVKRMASGNGGRLTGKPLFKRVQGFDRFETSARAFVDVKSLTKLAAGVHRGAGKVLNDLGVDGIESVVFYSGFAGRAERGLVELDVPGPRKGILKLLTGKPFRLADVPPLPPDVISWQMTNLDLAVLYDVLLKGAEDVVQLVSPKDVPKIKVFTDQLNTTLGVDLRKDVLASLGDRMVRYSSPSEGPLTLGQTVLVRVKDSDKLQEVLDQLVENLGKAGGAELRIKKRKYHGVTVREVHVKQQGFFFVPSYAIHDGWLVVALFPQPVHGYLRRATNKLPAWKPSPLVQKLYKEMPQEFISVTYTDPRPTVSHALSLAPVIGGLVESFNPGLKIDWGSMPNAQEATYHLFPNVSVFTDDGKTLRLDSRASLYLPVDVTGLDTYAVLVAFALLFRAG